MISRRLLRIKVLQAAYAYFMSGTDSPDRSEKELFHGVGKTYELYLSVFLLIIELAAYARRRIDLARSKLSPNYEDLHPNTRFTDNLLIRHLEDHELLKDLIKKHKISWANHPELIREIYNRIIESEIYSEYLNESDVSWKSDRQFVLRILDEIIMTSLSLDQVLEERSIYWNDDLEFAVRMAEKSLRKFRGSDSDSSGIPVYPLFRDEEDREFAKKLFRNLIIHHKEYERLIDRHTRNWDVDRIAFMDILILELAIAEILENESIPTKVSFNEYIEIAKYYSTGKSSNFINGILDKIIQQLREENKIVKRGRGLIGEE
ncbi:MAG: transcription antitermination factor NusB [Bacteroidales bacterium]